MEVAESVSYNGLEVAQQVISAETEASRLIVIAVTERRERLSELYETATSPIIETTEGQGVTSNFNERESEKTAGEFFSGTKPSDSNKVGAVNQLDNITDDSEKRPGESLVERLVKSYIDTPENGQSLSEEATGEHDSPQELSLAVMRQKSVRELFGAS